MAKPIGISLLGTGTVGGGLYDLLKQNGALLRERLGFEFTIVNALARDKARANLRLENSVPVTTNWREAIADPRCDLVVELIGGETMALEIALACLQTRKPLITANKALLATNGDQLIAAAHKSQTGIYFEAAVAGAIPAIRLLRNSLAGEQVSSIIGIINGTCNYILSNMANAGLDFTQALEQANQRGYAEADPALDIDGWDAAHKAVIMSWLAFGTSLQMDNIHVRGVRGFDLADLQYAARFNYVIKQIATMRAHTAGNEISVRPALVADNNTLAKVDNNLNALLFTAEASGELALIGAGAGASPTASAVLSDIIQATHELTSKYPMLPALGNHVKVLDFDQVCCESYLRIQAIDSKGLVAKLSALLDQASISIEAIHQDESTSEQPTTLVFLLHEAPWNKIQAYADQVGKFKEVLVAPVIMPIAIPHPKAK